MSDEKFLTLFKQFQILFRFWYKSDMIFCGRDFEFIIFYPLTLINSFLFFLFVEQQNGLAVFLKIS